MKLFVGAISLTLSVMTNAEEAKSIKYTTPSGSLIIITDLGLLPGGTFSTGLAINNEPIIVGLANDSNFDIQRPFWDANTGAIVGFADNFNPASTAIPEHVNDTREMAGSEVYGDNVYQGIYWNTTGQAFVLKGMAGVDPFYGGLHTRSHCINNLGQLVGTGKEAEPNFYTHAVLWPNKDEEAVDLGFLGQGEPLNYSEAYGINDLSHVVGVSAVGSLIVGFLWRNGQMIALPSLNGQVIGEPHAINNTGMIAGKSNIYPVTWAYDISDPNSTPTITELPIPTGFFTALPAAINDFGDAAGYAGSPGIDAHAILWRNGIAIDLGVWPGGNYSVAKGINNLGQIVGTGTIANDNLDHALMWIVVDDTAPVAFDQSLNTNEDTPLNILLVATDADGDPLTYSIVSLPVHGTLSGAAPDVTYSPFSDYNGADSFTFKANDGIVDSNVATVSITVLPVNDPPVATDDSATTLQDTPVIVAVLANDTDQDGDTLTIIALTQGSNGTVSDNGNGTVTYTPNIGFNGSDSFTYTISDGNGGLATATVGITVTPPAACLFCDDFEDGVLAGNWTYIKAVWTEANGSLIGTPTGKKGTAVAAPAFGGCINCSVEAKLASGGGTGNRVWLLGWYADKNNTMELMMKQESGKWILKERSNGKIVAKAKGFAAITPNVLYDIEVVFDGAHFTVTIDGSQLMQLTPAAAVPSGTVGFSVKSTTVYVGEVSVN